MEIKYAIAASAIIQPIETVRLSGFLNDIVQTPLCNAQLIYTLYTPIRL